MTETTDTTTTAIPDLNTILDDLQGFGIEEAEEILSITSSGKVLRFRFSNISACEDLMTQMANEDKKGYAWFQEVKIEVLSYAISWLNGVNLRHIAGTSRVVVDKDTGEKVDFRVHLRKTIRGWGVEVVQVLWKALMVHMQGIEDRLFESLPSAAVLTQSEMRYKEKMEREFSEVTRDVLTSKISQFVDEQEAEAAIEDSEA